MNALMIKDLLNIGSNKRIYITMIILFAFLSYFNASDGAGFLTVYISILCMMLVVSTFRYDEYSKWDRYALALPLTRKDIITGRYLFAIITMIAGLTLNVLLGLATALIHQQVLIFADIFLEPLFTLMAIFVLLMILFPLIYRYGSEKARLMMFLSAIVIVGIAVAAEYLGETVTLPAGLLTFLNDFGLWILIIIVIAISLLSYRQSLRIYGHKEF